jgi:nucleoside-diphosphate-sugar epimerase
MHVVVTGATGNLGSATVRELSAAGHEVTGVARRSPVDRDLPGTTVSWREADISTDDLAPVVAGADVVVHLAWRFQPTRSPETTWATNAVGTRRLLDAVAAERIPTLVCVTSVAAYSPVDHDEPVDESWPTDGTSAAAYCREKAYVERCLDGFACAHPGQRLVRLRPAFVFQRSAASEQRRIFGGPLARPGLFDVRRIPVVPVPRGLRFQAVHAGDVAAAVVAAVERPVEGAFNLAGHGLLRRADVGSIVGARTVEVPSTVVRSSLAGGFRGHVMPAPPELYDALVRLPVMDTGRAHRVLDWSPRHSAQDAVAAFLDGARLRGGSDLPPLHP